MHLSNSAEYYIYKFLNQFSLKLQSYKLKEAVINDRLLVLEVSWKCRIPTIYNFAVI